MKRKIINIDTEKCNGCGLCIPNCPEGAIRIIDGKARLISDMFCDGLGACLGHCPEGAITIEEREAEAFDETKVMKNIIPHGINTIKAHIEHLKDHGEDEYLKEALAVLKEEGISLDTADGSDDAEAPGNNTRSAAHGHHHEHHHGAGGGCPGSLARRLNPSAGAPAATENSTPSALAQWPVQMHLINPAAGYFQNSDLLIAADCTAYALGDFHSKHLKGKSLAIACPKLDQAQQQYIPKITALIDEAGINSITVMMMEVPCCGGLLSMVSAALENAQRKIPVKKVIAGIEGQILSEEWVNLG